MPKKSLKRIEAELVLSDSSSSPTERAKAKLTIARLDARAAYMSEYEKRRRVADPAYKEKRRKSKSEWKKRNSEATYRSVRRHHKKRLGSDPKFRIEALMRSTMHRGLRGEQHRSKYLKHLDWTFEDLRQRLEAQFSPEMTWDNLGDVWEIDHIEPRASFKYDAFDHPDFVACWRLSNLKPTLKDENRAQGYKLSYGK